MSVFHVLLGATNIPLHVWAVSWRVPYTMFPLWAMMHNRVITIHIWKKEEKEEFPSTKSSPLYQAWDGAVSRSPRHWHGGDGEAWAHGDGEESANRHPGVAGTHSPNRKHVSVFYPFLWLCQGKFGYQPGSASCPASATETWWWWQAGA